MGIGYILPKIGGIVEGFCASFGRRVRESTFCNIYICIGYMLPTFGVYASVGGFLCALALGNVHFVTYTYLYWIYATKNGEMFQLEGFCAFFGSRPCTALQG